MHTAPRLALVALTLTLGACSTLPLGFDEFCPDDPLVQSCPEGMSSCVSSYPCVAYCVVHHPDGADIPTSGMGAWCDDLGEDFDIGEFCQEHLDVEGCSDWCVAHPDRCDSAICGDGACTGSETAVSCSDDCPAICGDGECTHDENAGTCSRDCPASCGDGYCSHDEIHATCPADCSVECGNDRCDDELGEDVTNCPSDCHAVCGDEYCTHDENALGCPGDCPAVCGDDACTHEEDASTCPRDCSSSCGDGLCTHAETAASCASDCDAVCGDGACTHLETAASCPSDCSETCGDGECTHDETPARCPADCPAICSDSFCTHDENASSCPADCPKDCGDTFCTHDETAASCPDDCPQDCGDTFCTHDENASSCPADCPAICGDTFCTHTEDARCAVDCPPLCGDSFVTHDEDCEGSTENSCSTSCGSQGYQSCLDCHWSETCHPPDESCDGDDDDCDGIPDNGFTCAVGSTGSCTTTCGSTGSHECDASCEWPGFCSPPDETCNGVDDDCDGAPDEDFTCVRGTTGSCTTTCGTTGSRVCNTSCGWPASCTPPAETCNGADDDCDGAPDEDFTCVRGTTGSCTTTCGTTGSHICNTSCSWPTFCEPPSEVCNGIDDNCTGAADEGCACQSDWTIETTLSSVITGAFVWGTDWNDVHAVGAWGSGTSIPNVSHFDGVSWTGISSGTTAAILSVWGATASDVYGVGTDGAIVHYNGVSWTGIVSPTTDDLFDIWGADGNDIYAVGKHGTIIHYDGTAWSVMTWPEPGHEVDLYGIWGSSADNVYAVGDDGYILRRVSRGAWVRDTSLVTGVNYRGIWGRNPNDIFIIGSHPSSGNGMIAHTTMSGWREDIIAPATLLVDVWMTPAGSTPFETFVVGYSGTILRYTGDTNRTTGSYDPTLWSTEDIGTDFLVSVWGSRGSNIFIGGFSGNVYHHCGSGW